MNKPIPYLVDEIDQDTWVVSDTHFGHEAIMKFEPTRTEEMSLAGFSDQTEWLIHNWNQVVGKDDLVLHLGDFAFQGQESLIHQLNGRIVMLVGNHDMASIERFRKYSSSLSIANCCLVEGVISNEMGYFNDILGFSGLMKEINGKKIFFSHYPLLSDDSYLEGRPKAARDAMAEVFMEECCDLNIHGHLHSKDAFTDKSIEINVSVERIGFRPVKLKSVLGDSGG